MSARSFRDCLLFPTAGYAASILAISYGAAHWSLAIYALSFWHYGVYALAFFWRATPLEQFKSDAVLLKGLSLGSLACAYVPTLSSAVSVLVVLGGFALNTIAAWRIGSDRTYYGYELAGMPAQWSSAFPFSFLPHPMLTGNIAAYCGLLLDTSFRQNWAPLALFHAGLNMLILVMEVYGDEGRLPGTVWTLGGLAAGSALVLISYHDVWPFALAAIAVNAVFGAFLFRRYTKVRNQRAF